MSEFSQTIQKTRSLKYDVNAIRKDFSILSQKIYGNPLVYFDNGASSQKPDVVANRLSKYYKEEHSNIHRGVHFLSQQATESYETSRKLIASFIGTSDSDEVILTKGTTDGINLVASSFGDKFVSEKSNVVISAMEHHSNIVPWQMLCNRKQAELRVIPVTDKGELDVEGFERLIDDNTAIVAINHVSNTLGTINPVKQIIEASHKKNIAVLLDGAQAVPHLDVDVKDLDVDFYAFSSHKMYGPTGIGVLYGKRSWLEQMPPYQGGGDMIDHVTFEKTTYNEIPHKFEAGTPNIADGIAFGEAIKYVTGVGLENIKAWENHLLEYALIQMRKLPRIRFVGEAENRAGVISFLQKDIHPYDTGTILDQMGIAVRTGHHCTEPLMKRFEIPGTVRASFAMYNTTDEIDRFIDGLERAEKMLR